MMSSERDSFSENIGIYIINSLNNRKKTCKNHYRDSYTIIIYWDSHNQ